LRTGIHKKELVPSIIEPELFSLLNLLEVAEGDDSAIQCVLKADRCGILVVWGSGQGPATVRWCPPGALGVDPDSDVYPRLADTLAQILSEGFEQNKGIQPLVRVCGELAVEPRFFEALAAQAPSMQFMLWDSFLKLSLSAEGNVPRSVLQCVGAIGAALRSGGDRK